MELIIRQLSAFPRLSLALFSMLLLTGPTVSAELKPEVARAETLPDKPGAHWLWVNDLVFNHMEAGKAFLVDGDSGQMLGMLSTGFFFESLILPSDYSTIYSPEIYYTRGTRGKREDVVAEYDTRTLAHVKDIDIPPKKSSSVSLVGHAGLTSDNRFMAVYNFTPAQSVSIVDLVSDKFVEEVETPGCAQVYTAGGRAFNMVCGDGTMLTLQLDDSGHVTGTKRSARFYDPKADQVDDKVARLDDTWYFFTLGGVVKPVDMSQGTPKFLPEWSLFGDDDGGWRAGGFQYAAINPPLRELYILVHEGGKWTHKDPGRHVWVYDLASRKRVRQIALSHLATSIEVSQDTAPLLFSAIAEDGNIQIYNALSGEHLREISHIGFSPILLQAVPIVK